MPYTTSSFAAPQASRKVVFMLALLGGGLAAWWALHSGAPAPAEPLSSDSARAAFPWSRTPAVVDDATALDAQQVSAAAAALRELGSAELAGPVTERPDFVSLLEWKVLQAVAQKSDHPQQELTRLINDLRFEKLLDAWRSPASGLDAATRRRLAAQLRQDTPVHLARGELSAAEASQLQRELQDATTRP